jgi:hypothetical protein
VLDTNLRTVSATYPSEEAMIALAAANWTLSPKDQEAMGNAFTSSATGAVTVILQGFVGIALKAVKVLSTPS